MKAVCVIAVDYQTHSRTKPIRVRPKVVFICLWLFEKEKGEKKTLSNLRRWSKFIQFADSYLECSVNVCNQQSLRFSVFVYVECGGYFPSIKRKSEFNIISHLHRAQALCARLRGACALIYSSSATA